SAVVAFDVIEHLDREAAFAFARELCGVLCPGGRCIIHTVNGASPFQGSSVMAISLTSSPTRTDHSVSCLPTRASSFRFFEDTPTVHGVKSAIRWLGWKSIRACLRMWT